MQALWGERRRIGLWRRLWLALMEAQKDLGLDIPDAAIRELRAHLDDADLDKAAEYERRLRHDVMAHIHHLGDQAPAARPFIHLGATSAFVTDNADLVLMRRGLELLRGKAVRVLTSYSGPRSFTKAHHTHSAVRTFGLFWPTHYECGGPNEQRPWVGMARHSQPRRNTAACEAQ